MLLGVNPLLRGSLLAALDEMGHGELLLVADANFPARRFSASVVDLPGVNAVTATEAVVTVFPVDVAEPVGLMTAPGGTLPIHFALLSALGSRRGDVEHLSRFDFYDRARGAAVIIATGEQRPYGNLLLSKGVVNIGQDQ